MTPSERSFVLLCSGEVLVVLAGMVNLPLAILLQFLIPLLIFREFLTPLRTGVIFGLAYITGLIIVIASVLSFRHMTLPLLLLSTIVVIAIFTLLLGETRLRRRYGGVV